MYLGISRYSGSCLSSVRSVYPARVASLLSLLALCWSAGGLSGCAGTPKEVVSIARQDLACPSADVAQISDDRYGASGCGRGAVYTRTCNAGDCRWGRLRHGHETAIAGQLPPAPAPAAREIVPAPPPAARDVLPAPAPGAREILPAPPPNTGSANPADSGTNTAPATPNAAPAAPGDAAPAPGAAPAPTVAPAPVPLSQGELSEPYDATVPERPLPQQTAYAPPQPLVDDRPPPPAPSYTWVRGYWWWGAGGWVWLPGYWCSPMVGYNYYPGYWYYSSNYWWYWPGGWAHPGSTTIVYQTAPRPHRIARVRAFTPRSGGSTSHVTASRSDPAPRNIGRATSTTPTSGFRPDSSPLLRYPSTASRGVAAGTGFGRMTSVSPANAPNAGNANAPGRVRMPGQDAGVSRPNRALSVGRIVRPGSVSSRPSGFATSRSISGPSPAVRRAVTPGISRPSSAARFITPRSTPAPRAPSVGRAQRR